MREIIANAFSVSSDFPPNMGQSYELLLIEQKISWKNVMPMLICVLSVFCRGRGTVDALLCPIVGKVLTAVGQVVTDKMETYFV